MYRNILIVCLFLLPMFSIAKDDDKVIKITFSQFPPFEFSKDEKAVGFTVDLISDIFKAAGYEPQFISLPWKRALEAAKAGEVDIITHLRRSEEREKYFIYSNPIIYSQHYFFKKKTLDIYPISFSELNSYTIATVNGYFYGDKFDDAHFKHLVPIATSEPAISNLRKLIAGRVDLVACQVNVCGYLIDQHKEEFAGIDYIASLPIDVTEPTYIAFPKVNLERSEHLLQVFNAGLAQYIAEGKKAKLIAKYNLDGVK